MAFTHTTRVRVPVREIFFFTFSTFDTTFTNTASHAAFAILVHLFLFKNASDASFFNFGAYLTPSKTP